MKGRMGSRDKEEEEWELRDKGLHKGVVFKGYYIS